MMDFNFDATKIFEEIEKKINFEYRDPLLPPYGAEDKITSIQREAWTFLKKWTGYGPMIAMIAAKGAAKTHFGACFAWHQAQMYPESVGCLVSNTFSQAKDNGLPIFLRVGKALGFEAEYFEHKKVHGRVFNSVVVLKMAENVYSYMLIRSYDAIQNFEGVEIDWLWSEEGQDTTFDNFNVPVSRNRGQYADNAIFYAAMPDDESHWQYSKLPVLGMVEKDKFVEPEMEAVIESRKPGYHGDPIEVGIMYEFSVYVNVHNVGKQYIGRNSRSYTGVLFDRYVLGLRGASQSSRLFSSYSRGLHRDGFMSEFLRGIDYTRDAVAIFDFNVAPCCVTVWQEKPWNDKWAEECFIEDGQLYRTVGGADSDQSEPLSDITLVAPPDRTIHMQVAEIECWEGGTRGAMQMLVDKLQDFTGTLYVNGDATGNSMRSSATVTDWDIVRDYLSTNKFDFVLQPGLVVNYPEADSSKSITYTNPSRGDTINLLNILLKDNAGRVHMAFLPSSEYDSGGAAASVEAMKTKPDGTWDESCDKKIGKDVPRTHFTDTVRYYAWYATGGSILSVVDDFDDTVAELRHGRQMARAQEQYGIRRPDRSQGTGPNADVISGNKRRSSFSF